MNTDETTTRGIEKSLMDIDFAALTRGPFTPSPAAWEDQVLYFLMLDRFSDGKEKGGYADASGRPVEAGSTPLYSPEGQAQIDYDIWFRAGGGWQGGTIKGLTGKLGYLRRLGVTALWISPPFRQVAFEPSYHGYGVQNFLDVDPHFGTREEFRDFVRAAHEQGIYVILDVIAHHTGNVFSYNADRYPTHDPATGSTFNDPRWDGMPYAVAGFNDREGRPTLPFGIPHDLSPADAAKLEASWPDGAVWPREFQRGDLFLRKGHITNWGHYPEYAEGDMAGGLKTLDVRVRWAGQYRRPSPAMAWLCLAYCFWIAYADLDGFRIDAARHMDVDALRSFCDWIREFAQSIGKERFLLVGEVPGGRDLALEVVEKTGLDAALGIDDIPGKLERMVTGEADPIDYFSIFRNWRLDEPEGGKHRWYRDQVVTLVDDHDQVRKWTAKRRFCGDSRYRDLAFNVMAAQLTTAGIPCIYYGSEQGFDSGGRVSNSDMVLRENMLGGRFGGLCTQGRHFFNEQGDLYRALASLTALRKQLITLRRGSQVLHRISGDGVNFGHPRRLGDQRMRSLVCWSRLFLDQETLVVFNTDPSQTVAAWSTVGPLLRVEGDEFQRLFWYTPTPSEPPPATLTVEHRNGLPTVRIQLPPAGFVIYQASPALHRLGPNRPPGLKPWAESPW
ncbi:MAG TPA: alpha-amylase family glycosyl hydrolase [Phycisphaerae bacterium]|nr:alpha-amylase family glycosyl hydrolase [Phycisphaerae bacterium]